MRNISAWDRRCLPRGEFVYLVSRGPIGPRKTVKNRTGVLSAKYGRLSELGVARVVKKVSPFPWFGMVRTQ